MLLLTSLGRAYDSILFSENWYQNIVIPLYMEHWFGSFLPFNWNYLIFFLANIVPILLLRTWLEMMESPTSWVTSLPWLELVSLVDLGIHCYLICFLMLSTFSFFSSSNLAIFMQFLAIWTSLVTCVTSYGSILLSQVMPCTVYANIFSTIVTSKPSIVVPTKYNLYKLFS